MPTYEYRCKACGHQLEVVQGFHDDALTKCPSCGAEELRKVFGAVGISFKGSGFYKNDSRGKSSSTTPAGGSSDSSSSGSSSDSTTTSSGDSSGSGSSSGSSGSGDAKTA